MGFEQELLNLIQDAIEKSGKATNLAKATGISNASLSRWKNCKTLPKVENLAPLCDYLGIKVLAPLDGYALVPKKEAKAGAGSSFETDGGTTGYYAFRRQFLQRMGISEDKASLFDVLGNSMQPVLENGDTILVDESKTVPQDGQIFLVGVDEELLVKRVVKARRGWILRSQNPDYPDMIFEGDDEVTALRIYGKVMWVGRVL